MTIHASALRLGGVDDTQRENLNGAGPANKDVPLHPVLLYLLRTSAYQFNTWVTTSSIVSPDESSW